MLLGQRIPFPVLPKPDFLLSLKKYFQHVLNFLQNIKGIIFCFEKEKTEKDNFMQNEHVNSRH